MSNKNGIIAIVGDVHAGSTVAPCLTKVRLDDGGWYHPSSEQKLLNRYWYDFWTSLGKRQRELDAPVTVIVNGEAVDGDHHGTRQIISKDVRIQLKVADKLFINGLSKLSIVEEMYVVRGTEAHSGPSGTTDEGFAELYSAVKDESRGTHSWWVLNLKKYGINLRVAHHANATSNPRTKGNSANALAADLVFKYAYERWRPDLAVFGHCHTWADSYDNHRIRVIQNGGWQSNTAYTHRYFPTTLPAIGALWIECDGNGSYQVVKKKYDLMDSAKILLR